MALWWWLQKIGILLGLPTWISCFMISGLNAYHGFRVTKSTVLKSWYIFLISNYVPVFLLETKETINKMEMSWSLLVGFQVNYTYQVFISKGKGDHHKQESFFQAPWSVCPSANLWFFGTRKTGQWLEPRACEPDTPPWLNLFWLRCKHLEMGMNSKLDIWLASMAIEDIKVMEAFFGTSC